MIQLPSSPALSDCDSLTSDDLEALLDAQGELSHLPTPPLTMEDARKADDYLDHAKESFDYSHIATLFTQEATVGNSTFLQDVVLVERILLRAQLPPEVLALALNILTALNCRSLPVDSFYSATSDLLAVSALSLAVLYTSDAPPPLSYWSRDVCERTWTAARISKTVFQMLATLDWRLHGVADPEAIQQTVERFGTSPISEASAGISDSEEQSVSCSDPHSSKQETAAPLRLVIEGTSACWTNGQMTPGATPTDFIPGSGENRFLPLL